MSVFRPALLLLILLAACTPRGAIIIDPAAAEVGTVRPVFVASSRGKDEETGTEYARFRNPETRFARFDVSIPPTHEPGQIVYTRPNHAANPQTDFLTTREIVYDEAGAFRADLARELRQAPRGSREAVIFVHGFNTTFAEGLYRIAQLSHDLKMPGVAVHYAWPSRGAPLAYAYDRDSALFARDGLERLLNEVTAAGAERVVLVGHSMGAALTMETLRQMAIAGKPARNIAGVVLISPDIDVDLFRAQATRIGELPQPFVIFTSKKDRALALSARVSGETARLGNVTDVALLSGLKVTMVDVTSYSTGVGHFTAGTSPALIGILSQLGEVDEALASGQIGETGLLPGVVLTVQGATQIVMSPVTALAGGLGGQ